MPEGWQSTSLGEVAELVSGHAFPRKEQGGSAGVPFIKVSDMNRPGNEIQIVAAENLVTPEQVQRMRLRTSPPGTILFPKVGAALLTEKRRITIGPTIFDNNIMGLVASDAVVQKFLLFWMQTVRLGDWAQEGPVPSVNNRIVRGLSIELPPVNEQRRIVDLIESIDTCIDSLDSQIDATRTARAGVLSELLSDPGQDWQDSTLGEATEIKQGETIAVKALAGGPHPVFGANGIVGWHERGNVTEDTVALGCRGSCGTVHIAPAGSFLANNVMGVRAIDGKTAVGFLAVMLEFADLRGSGVISGQVQEQITRKSLAPLPVLLPPLGEQHRIVDLSASFGEQILSLESQVESARALRSGVLSELLSGERLLDDSYDMAVGL